MVACGKGFLVAHPQPPAVRDFLPEDRPLLMRRAAARLAARHRRSLSAPVALSDDDGGGRLEGGRHQLVQARTAVRHPFRGDDRARLRASRLLVSRIAAIACAAAMSISTLQLTNLPNLRDYAKAPFTLALVMILIALAVRPWRRREVLLLSLGYGLGHGGRLRVSYGSAGRHPHRS